MYLFPGEKVSRNYRVKEQHFTDHIKAAGILPNHSQVTFDKRLQGGCSGRKPDIFVDLYTHTVHCENDEDQHRNYTCENKRLMELFRDAGNRPQVQLRFNPDGFTTENGVRHPSCFKYNKYGVPVIRDQSTMAPPSRPIVAISATGAVTRYHSKRAASDATRIPAASVALAASNLALRDGFIWKFEDDPREVDMSRFQAAEQQTVAAPTADEVEYARDFVDALRGDDGRMITEMRLSDGYVSATKMCQSAGKNMSDYMRLQSTEEFMVQLANTLGCSRTFLVNRCETGPVTKRVTWIHPMVATNLAVWISTDFEVKVSIWLEHARRRLPGIDRDYRIALANLKPQRGNGTIEADVRDRLAEVENGQVEVLCDYGRVDVLTASSIIEVKQSKYYLHALGQVLGYAESFPQHRKRIHLIMPSDDEELLSRAKRVCGKHGVDVTCEIDKNVGI
ncbi:hypothetical protein KFL_011150060 [Klebsormidium nitens]|uniref:KilA-N domain-containing protein n=1 Tax=Klebsormidium nitens TaxID=105231 RepID=A0A1Y1IWV5_KLENI|nr:hypothetical protein KFL_011150060 [Klebsormidium nitens]|eukprot:GAQ92738.1 hypothetical protein KFL_011150060 [Klebsormidium nitens]